MGQANDGLLVEALTPDIVGRLNKLDVPVVLVLAAENNEDVAVAEVAVEPPGWLDAVVASAGLGAVCAVLAAPNNG